MRNHYNYFSTDGNALAIIFEIANNEKSKHIEEAAHIFEIHDVPSKCVHPNYPTKFISPLLKLIGLGDYHNGISWLWLGCISALSQNKAGKEKNAKILIKKISTIFINIFADCLQDINVLFFCSTKQQFTKRVIGFIFNCYTI